MRSPELGDLKVSGDGEAWTSMNWSGASWICDLNGNHDSSVQKTLLLVNNRLGRFGHDPPKGAHHPL